MRTPSDVTTTVRPREAGFSLLEILIAVMILVLMGGVVATNLFPKFFQAKRSRAEIDIKTIKAAVEQYRLMTNNKTNRLPEQSEFPQALIEPGEGGEPSCLDPDTLTDGKLLDPWGTEYVYVKHNNASFEIISYGEDCAPGGEGLAADISSKSGSKK
jgi:general secretion pathway protein G